MIARLFNSTLIEIAMIRLPVLFAALTLSAPLLAADPTKKGIDGYWLGTLHLGAIDLRLGFKFETKDGKLTAKLDSIDQGANDLPIESAEFTDGTLTLKMPKMKAGYVGK